MTHYTELSGSKRRITGLVLVLGVFGVALIVRLFIIQALSHDHYLALAVGSHSRKAIVPARRGDIFMLDRDQKTPLALSQALKVLYADPTAVTDKVKTARILANMTGDTEAAYYQAMQKSGDYVELKTKVSSDLAAKISDLNLAGIGLGDRQYRVYPEGSLASQLLGFVNTDGEGQYGLEGYLDSELVGSPGLLKAKTDTRGNLIATADNFIKPAVNGNSYVLTIDRNIQAQAEKYLKAGIEATRAKSGSVVIIDPASGAVRAMANYPTYDPNVYSEAKDYSLFTNPVISDQFEPGSGFKVFTMAAGLTTGKVKPDTTYNDTGEVEVDGRKIRNAANHKYDIQNMVDVIQKSLNTGAIFVLKSLGGDLQNINLGGKKILYEYLTKHFGFGVATGIEQAGETAGAVNKPTNQNGNNVNYANMTFGQGVSVTMMQMVTAVAAIANGGKLYQPHLVDEVIIRDQATKVAPKVINANVIPSAVAVQLTNMMVQVVEHGSGYATKIKGYKVAGKTGTAQIPKPGGNGYDENKNIGTFVGYAPADNPRFVMMVRINEPQVSGFAESTTVPVFGNIAQWLLRYYEVPPQ